MGLVVLMLNICLHTVISPYVEHPWFLIVLFHHRKEQGDIMLLWSVCQIKG